MRTPKIADAIICVTAAGCGAVALYAVAGLSGRAAGSAPLLWFLAVPVGLALGLIAALWLPVAHRQTIASVAASAILALAAAEAYLIAGERTREELAIEAATARGLTPDPRSRIEIIRDLERDGRPAYPSFHPSHGMKQAGDGSWRSHMLVRDQPVFPLSGIANVRTVVCNEYGPWLVFEADEHGFNNPAGLWNPGDADIVLIGDSFTLGSCVPRDDHFAAIIRATYARTVNLGYTAAGPIATYATLVEYGRYLRPRRILWFFFEGNDMSNLAWERRTPILMRYLTSGEPQGLIDLQPELDTVMKEIIGRLRASMKTAADLAAEARDYRRVFMLRRVRKVLGVPSYLRSSNDEEAEAVGALDFDLLRSVLDRAKETAAGWGGTLYLVYLPAWRRGRDVAGVDPLYQSIRGAVGEIAAGLGIKFIDVAPAFERHPRWQELNSYVGRGGHYSPLGYRTVAETVLGYFAEEEKKIDPKPPPK